MSTYIPDSFIEDLKRSVPIGEFIESTGVKLKRAGATSEALCPFPGHKEKTPSFNVIHNKNFCYCHGCKTGGDVFDYLKHTTNLSFRERIETVARFAGMELPTNTREVENGKTQALQSTLNHVLNIYQGNLEKNKNPPVTQLLKSRNINADSIKRFMLGVAKDDWTQIRNALGGKERLKLLTESGVCIYIEENGAQKEKFYDRFRNGLIFPIRDLSGQVVSFAIRHLEGRAPKYINGPETSLFKKKRTLFGLYEALRHNSRPDSLVVVEGYMDVIKMSQHGFHNGVAPMGSSLTDPQIQNLFRKTNEVTFCFDGDKAGYQAAKKSLFSVLGYVDDSHTYKFSLLPQGYDPDLFLDEFGASEFSKQLESASPLSEFVFTVLMEDKDLSIRENVAKLAEEFSGLLNEMPDSHLKLDLVKRFEDKTGIPLRQSLKVKVATKDMPPSQILALSNNVREFIANRGGVSATNIKVDITADHYKPDTQFSHFINQKSVISHSLPMNASCEEKIKLLNQAMEQVVLNSNLSFKDDCGIPVVQILTDAYKNVAGASDSEKRLQMMCVAQLKRVLADHNMSDLVDIVSTEVNRILRLSDHIIKKHPDQAANLPKTLKRFTNCVQDNIKYLDALGRFAPSEAYGEAYSTSVNALKVEIRNLSSKFPESRDHTTQVQGIRA